MGDPPSSRASKVVCGCYKGFPRFGGVSPRLMQVLHGLVGL